jgi:hypothetical protein
LELFEPLSCELLFEGVEACVVATDGVADGELDGAAAEDVALPVNFLKLLNIIFPYY